MDIPMKPKVAVVMTGLPRFCADTDTLINNLTNYDSVDWYVAFWQHQPRAMSALNTAWQALSVSEMILELEARLPAGHTVKSFNWVQPEDTEPMPRDYTPFYSWPINTWQQYQILKWQWTRTPVEQYDLVVRGRADGGMSRSLDLADIYRQLQSSPDALITPDDYRSGSYSFNDHMAIGLPEAVGKLAHVVDHFDEAYSQGTPFNAEILIGRILNKQGITWPASGWTTTLKTTGRCDADGVFQPELGRWPLAK